MHQPTNVMDEAQWSRLGRSSSCTKARVVSARQFNCVIVKASFDGKICISLKELTTSSVVSIHPLGTNTHRADSNHARAKCKPSVAMTVIHAYILFTALDACNILHTSPHALMGIRKQRCM